MFLYSKYKISKELIIRIYDDGATLSESTVSVDSDNKSSNIESMYRNIETLLATNKFAPECIDEVMKVVKSQSKVVNVPFKTVRISEDDIIKVVYIQNGEIKEATGSILNIYESPLRHVYLAGSNTNMFKVYITLDTSKEYEYGQLEIFLDDIRDIEVIENRMKDPFGDEYPEYEDLTPDVVELGESYKDAVNNEEFSVLTFTSGKFNEEIHINRNTPITLVGKYAGVLADKDRRSFPFIDEYETIINGTIVIENAEDKMADVTFDGFTFTDKSIVDIKCEGNVTFKNCKFMFMSATDEKSFIIRSSDPKPVKLVIENCYFGTNLENELGDIYNAFELDCILKDGSSISNNYFTKYVCTNNIINIYNVEEDSTININNNYFEYSANAIRIGIKGEPTCTINIFDNTYDQTYPLDEYAGLVLVQPYGKETTSFANCTINIINTIHSDDGTQLYYLYAGENDRQFTEENKPTINTELPIIDDEEEPPVDGEEPKDPEDGNDDGTTDSGNEGEEPKDPEDGNDDGTTDSGNEGEEPKDPEDGDDEEPKDSDGCCDDCDCMDELEEELEDYIKAEDLVDITAEEIDEICVLPSKDSEDDDNDGEPVE